VDQFFPIQEYYKWRSKDGGEHKYTLRVFPVLKVFAILFRQTTVLGNCTKLEITRLKTDGQPSGTIQKPLANW